eukprot:TRINITY_DN3649_c0_g1_i1.p1 TRINITY_DN3649_c0_g1~~TRINITY_DN3649_c0_g1_i1.p1  ORF type:complete len:370 (-),score=30.51 TRINITY_DN3649_c0_g1_i1:66-1175(-)
MMPVRTSMTNSPMPVSDSAAPSRSPPSDDGNFTGGPRPRTGNGPSMTAQACETYQDPRTHETEEEQSEDNWLHSFRHLVSGMVGGGGGVFIGHPFDTVKVRLQTQSSSNPVFRGAVHCVTKTVKDEGPRGIFRGVGPPVMGEMATGSLVFGIYGTLCSYQKDNSKTVTTAKEAYIAGLGVGMVGAMLLCPIELIKVRMQVQRIGGRRIPLGEPKSTIDWVSRIWKGEGLRGFYRGFGACWFRDMPAFALYFGVYEGYRGLFTEVDSHGMLVKDAPVVHQLMAGGLGGVASWSVTYPFDVIKSKMQRLTVDTPKEKQYKGLVDCAKRLYKANGMMGFYRGLGPTVARAFPVNAATFYLYNEVLKATHYLF